jgi:N6-L-threonylcarbamoyladenine synthase
MPQLSKKTNKQFTYILGIESSCDDTAAAVLKNDKIISNKVANQVIHEQYGGVVPELASRAHQQNIVPVVDMALREAGIDKSDLSAIAFTEGPGLLGSLLVGASFAKSLSLALNIPLIGVHHMQAHILAHFIQDDTMEIPEFPFLALTISGGHTQIVQVNKHLDFKVLGETRDDAVGEAFDKSAKIMGLPYPCGPLIDKYAKEGNPKAFAFPKPKVDVMDFSFSGLKTSILYFLQKKTKENPDFIKENLTDLSASIQHTIVNILMDKLKIAVETTGINRIAIAGGVSANSGIRQALSDAEKKLDWKVYLPKFEFTTDNAAMVAITGYFKYQQGLFDDFSIVPKARMPFG